MTILKTMIILLVSISSGVSSLKALFSTKSSAVEAILRCMEQVVSYQPELIMSLHKSKGWEAGTLDIIVATVARRLHADGRWTLALKDTTGLEEQSWLRDNSIVKFRVLPARPASIFVTIVGEVASLRAHLDALERDPTWNSRANFVMVVGGEGLDSVPDAVAELWARRVADVVVLFLTTLEVFTWFPYVWPHCAGVPPPHLIDVWSSEERRFVRGAEFFPEKELKNLSGCTVTVSTVIWPPFVQCNYLPKIDEDVLETDAEFLTDGLDVKIMRLVAERINLTIRYRIHIKSMHFGAVKDVILNLSEVAFGGVSQSLVAYNVIMEESVPYQQEVSTWYVPDEEPVAFGKSLTRAFEPYVWLLLFFSSITAACTIRIFSLREPKSTSLSRCFFVAFTTLLVSNTSIRIRSWPLRIFVVLYVVQCMITNVAYQSSLVSNLANPGTDHEVSSLDELISQGWRFIVHPVWIDYIQAVDDWRYDVVLSRHENCSSVVECLDRVVSEDKTVAGGTVSYVEFYMPSRYMKGNKKLIRPLESSGIWTTRIVMLTMQNSLLKDRLNHVLEAAVQSGLVSKWWVDLTFRNGNRNSQSDCNFTLTTKQMFSPIIILLLGCGISALVFVGELITYSLRKNSDITPDLETINLH